MKELESYLLEYFKDWDLTEKEKDELQSICENTSIKLTPLYEKKKKMAESTKFREDIIETIDETLTEKKDDNKTDT